MELHVFHHLVDDPSSHHLLQAILHKLDHLGHLSAQLTDMEQRLKDTLMETVEGLRAEITELRTNIANEIQQLADAIVNAGNNQAAIDEAVAGLRELNTTLRSDDPIVPSV